MDQELDKLDNPAWWALNGPQQIFAHAGAHVSRYRRGILPFAAIENSGADLRELDQYLNPGEIFFLIGKLLALPGGWTLEKELPCSQMICRRSEHAASSNISPLNATHRSAMFELINKVQPGYYEPDTHQLGDYVGVWENDQLVAVAGERMRLENLTEISAICTDPGYTGRGYAQLLIAHLCKKNIDNGITPFLHVLTSNERAVRLYEYMGFSTRRIISFWKLRKD